MNNKKYKGAGGATFLTFIVIVFLALWLTNRMQVRDQDMTYQSFVQEVKDSQNVKDVNIKQNKTVPTGVVTVTLKNSDTTKQVNVSDVNAVQELLEKYKIDYQMPNVQEDSWLTTILMPLLFTFLGITLNLHVHESSGRRCQCKGNEFRQEPGQDDDRF